MSRRRIELTITMVVEAEGDTIAAINRDMHLNATLRAGYVMGRCTGNDFGAQKPGNSSTFDIDGTKTFSNFIATVTTKELTP